MYSSVGNGARTVLGSVLAFGKVHEGLVETKKEREAAGLLTAASLLHAAGLHKWPRSQTAGSYV